MQEPPINQAGNIIRVGDMGNEWMHHVSIDYDVTAPSNTMLQAESGSGDLKLSNMTGTVKGHTGSGSIEADKLGAGIEAGHWFGFHLGDEFDGVGNAIDRVG